MAGLTTVTSGGIADGSITNADINASASIDASKVSGLSTDKIEEGNTAVEVVDTGSDGHITFDTEGDERARILANGKILVGATADRTGWNNGTIGSNFLQLERAAAGSDVALTLCSNAGTNALGTASIFLGKTRGTSVGAVTAVANGDQLGQISFQGADGSELVEAARIEGRVDGTTGTNTGDMPGSLRFYTTPDNSPTVSERMRIDSAGILRHTPGGGTSTTYLQQRVDNTNEYTFRALRDGVNDTQICFDTQISGTAAERMRISSGGFVGIGSTNPTATLQVTGPNTSSRGQLTIAGSSGGSGVDARMTFYRGTDFIGAIMGNSDHINLATESGHHLEFSTAGTERLRINTDGGIQVGGTTVATKARLHVNDNHGSVQSGLVSRSDSMMSWTSDNEAYLTGYFNSTRGYNASDTTQHSIGVYATASSRNTGGATGVYGYGTGAVGSGGGVGVYGASLSTYASGGPSCGVKGYRPRGASTGWGMGVWGQCETSVFAHNFAGFFEILPKTGTDTDNIGIGVVGRDSGRTFYGMRFGTGTSTLGTLVGSIQFSSSGTSFNTSSDYRLKENVVDLTGAITRLKTIPVRRFNFKTDPDKTVDGFIAHEVSSIVPEAVSGTKDEVENEYDDEGNVTSTTPVYQGIDQAKLVPLLTAALQEAIAEIETLKTKVAALEAG